MSNIIDSIQLSGVTYTLSAETSGGGITSGEVQTMIDASISGKVNVSDNEVPPYYKYTTEVYPKGFPTSSTTATNYADGADVIYCLFTRSNLSRYKYLVQVIDSNNNTYSGETGVIVARTGKTASDVDALPSYVDVVDFSYNGMYTWKYVPKTGYKISACYGYSGYDANPGTNPSQQFSGTTSELLFSGGQSSYVIENVIEPELVRLDGSLSTKTDTSAFTAYSASVETVLSGKQDTLSAGTGISIVDNVISATGGGSSYTAGDGIDITNDVISVTGKVDTSTYNTYTAATDTALASKADTATTYTKTETDNAITSATSTKQDTLVSGTNIKTINNESLLGSGNIDVQGSGNPTVELTQAEYDALVSAGTVSADTYYIITDAEAGDLTNYYTKTETNTLLGGKANTATTYTKTEVDTALSGKQATLVSGTNIKTINNESLLGSGNIVIQGGGGGGKAIEAGRGITITTGVTADTVSFNLPISAGTGTNSIVEGDNTTASGMYGSHAEGYHTSATGWGAHAEGNNTTASGNYSHAEGNQAVASGNYSHTEGFGTTAINSSEHASGQYNVSRRASTTFGDSGNTLFSVGNGTSISAKHNAFEIRQDGSIYLNDGTNDVKLQDTIIATAANTTALGGLSLVKLTQAQYDALATKDNSTLYVIVN